MGVSRYSPEGLPPEEFPLDMRYRINALQKLALSSYHAGKYEEALKFILKALEKNPLNQEVLELLATVKKESPESVTSKFDSYLEKYELPEDEGEGGGEEGQGSVEEKTEVAQSVDQAKKLVARVEGGGVDEDGPVKVLSPKVMKPRLVKGGKVTDSIQELAQKAKYNPPPEVSDLFDFDDEELDDEQGPTPTEGSQDDDVTSRERHTRRTARVLEKLRAGKAGGKPNNKSELHKQIKGQLNKFKAEGFLVSRVEKMMKDPKMDSKKLLDEVIVLSSQIEMLKELKKRADALEQAPGANKAKLMTLKLRLSDPDRVSEIIQEIESMELELQSQ